MNFENDSRLLTLYTYTFHHSQVIYFTWIFVVWFK